MSCTWSWSDVPGLDPETLAIARRAYTPRSSQPPATVKPRLALPPQLPAPAVAGDDWCVWSGNRGAFLTQDQAGYEGRPGEWSMAEAKAIAASRDAGEAVAAIPIPVPRRG